MLVSSRVEWRFHCIEITSSQNHVGVGGILADPRMWPFTSAPYHSIKYPRLFYHYVEVALVIRSVLTFGTLSWAIDIVGNPYRPVIHKDADWLTPRKNAWSFSAKDVLGQDHFVLRHPSISKGSSRPYWKPKGALILYQDWAEPPLFEVLCTFLPTLPSAEVVLTRILKVILKW